MRSSQSSQHGASARTRRGATASGGSRRGHCYLSSPFVAQQVHAVLVCLLIGAAYFIAMEWGLPAAMEAQAREQRKVAHQQQLKEAKALDAQLRLDIERHGSDYIEWIPGDRHDYVRPGEVLFRVVDVPPIARPATAPGATTRRAGPWAPLLDWLTGEDG